MSIPIPALFVRRWFARAYNNGEAYDYSSLDTQHADLVEGFNLMRARINSISTADGVLITLASTTSFTATASQTAFTVASYDTTNDTVHVYVSGLRLAAASITKTNATTVTIPAQTVGTPVQIDIWTPGSGTTALASTSIGQGASLMGVDDAGGLFTATDVDGVTQELGTNLASAAYLGGILTISNYLLKSGGTMTGAIAMGSNKITGLAAGTASSNDAARMADITSAALQTAMAAYLASTYLALSGGTMSGNIAMGGSAKVTGLGAATVNGDAVRYNEFMAINGSQITAGTVVAARMAVLVGDAGAGGTQGVVPAPAAGDAALVKFLRADATWAIPPASLGSKIILQHIISSGTAGGSAAGTTWTDRPINTETLDQGNNCTLTANQFTLAAGTYSIDAAATMFNTNESNMRLRNITDGSTTLVGSGGRIDNTDATSLDTRVVGRFTIASPKVFSLQYWAGAAKGTNGLGYDLGTGENNIFLTAVLIKE